LGVRIDRLLQSIWSAPSTFRPLISRLATLHHDSIDAEVSGIMRLRQSSLIWQLLEITCFPFFPHVSLSSRLPDLQSFGLSSDGRTSQTCDTGGTSSPKGTSAPQRPRHAGSLCLEQLASLGPATANCMPAMDYSAPPEAPIPRHRRAIRPCSARFVFFALLVSVWLLLVHFVFRACNMIPHLENWGSVGRDGPKHDAARPRGQPMPKQRVRWRNLMTEQRDILQSLNSRS
jgi:hypothetical protein